MGPSEVLGEPPLQRAGAATGCVQPTSREEEEEGKQDGHGEGSSIPPEVKTRTKDGSFAEGQANIEIRRHFVTRKTIKPNFLPFAYLYLLHSYATHLAIENDGLYPAFYFFYK